MPINYSEENTGETCRRVSTDYEIETYNISSEVDYSFSEIGSMLQHTQSNQVYKRLGKLTEMNLCIHIYNIRNTFRLE